MPRHHQPREVADFKGATKKNPQRYKKEIPVHSVSLGDAPAHLSKESKKVWLELKEIALPGVLKCTDGLIFEISANLIAEYRQSPKDFSTPKLNSLIGCLARLGMSPSDRQKLGMDGQKNTADFGEF